MNLLLGFPILRGYVNFRGVEESLQITDPFLQTALATWNAPITDRFLASPKRVFFFSGGVYSLSGWFIPKNTCAVHLQDA